MWVKQTRSGALPHTTLEEEGEVVIRLGHQVETGEVEQVQVDRPPILALRVLQTPAEVEAELSMLVLVPQVDRAL